MRTHAGPLLTGLLFIAAFATPRAGQAPGAGVTVYEGARLIVGDGRAPIDDSAISACSASSALTVVLVM